MMKLAQIRIVTDDVPALTRFYQDVTGMTPNGDSRYVEFQTPTLALAISSVRMINQHSGGTAVPAANRTVILDFEVEDVDAERVRLASLIREFVLEPADRPWGNRSLMFRDPDGNLINFYSPIKAAARASAVAEA
jgi:catechol 2,3-dioxygenase-like lactoylglutathione lyase family enzyme